MFNVLMFAFLFTKTLLRKRRDKRFEKSSEKRCYKEEKVGIVGQIYRELTVFSINQRYQNE